MSEADSVQKEPVEVEIDNDMVQVMANDQETEHELIARVVRQRDWMLEHAPKGECANACKAHLAGYANDEQIAGWIALYRDTIVPAIPSFTGSTGVDFGCWTGLGTSILASFGAKRVFGAEVNTATMQFGPHWATQFGLDELRFLWNAGGVIPLPDRSVDWVYVNQVFCNMQPAGFDQAISQISRILCSGGRLVFCDSNNPHCPDTLERLERVYRTRELGDADAQNPAGVLFKQRVRIVVDLIPGIAVPDAERIARNTCYLGGLDLERAIIAWRESRIEPISPFVGGTHPVPVNPRNGIAAGNLTDPYDLATRFTKAGLRVSINTSATQGPTDPAELYERMTQSQSFYILGTKV